MWAGHISNSKNSSNKIYNSNHANFSQCNDNTGDFAPTWFQTIANPSSPPQPCPSYPYGVGCNEPRELYYLVPSGRTYDGAGMVSHPGSALGSDYIYSVPGNDQLYCAGNGSMLHMPGTPPACGYPADGPCYPAPISNIMVQPALAAPQPGLSPASCIVSAPSQCYQLVPYDGPVMASRPAPLMGPPGIFLGPFINSNRSSVSSVRRSGHPSAGSQGHQAGSVLLYPASINPSPSINACGATPGQERSTMTGSSLNSVSYPSSARNENCAVSSSIFGMNNNNNINNNNNNNKANNNNSTGSNSYNHSEPHYYSHHCRAPQGAHSEGGIGPATGDPFGFQKPSSQCDRHYVDIRRRIGSNLGVTTPMLEDDSRASYCTPPSFSQPASLNHQGHQGSFPPSPQSRKRGRPTAASCEEDGCRTHEHHSSRSTPEVMDIDAKQSQVKADNAFSACTGDGRQRFQGHEIPIEHYFSMPHMPGPAPYEEFDVEFDRGDMRAVSVYHPLYQHFNATLGGAHFYKDENIPLFDTIRCDATNGYWGSILEVLAQLNVGACAAPAIIGVPTKPEFPPGVEAAPSPFKMTKTPLRTRLAEPQIALPGIHLPQSVAEHVDDVERRQFFEQHLLEKNNPFYFDFISFRAQFIQQYSSAMASTQSRSKGHPANWHFRLPMPEKLLPLSLIRPLTALFGDFLLSSEGATVKGRDYESAGLVIQFGQYSTALFERDQKNRIIADLSSIPKTKLSFRLPGFLRAPSLADLSRHSVAEDSGPGPAEVRCSCPLPLFIKPLRRLVRGPELHHHKNEPIVVEDQHYLRCLLCSWAQGTSSTGTPGSPSLRSSSSGCSGSQERDERDAELFRRYYDVEEASQLRLLWQQLGHSDGEVPDCKSPFYYGRYNDEAMSAENCCFSREELVKHLTSPRHIQLLYLAGLPGPLFAVERLDVSAAELARLDQLESWAVSLATEVRFRRSHLKQFGTAISTQPEQSCDRLVDVSDITDEASLINSDLPIKARLARLLRRFALTDPRNSHNAWTSLLLGRDGAARKAQAVALAMLVAQRRPLAGATAGSGDACVLSGQTPKPSFVPDPVCNPVIDIKMDNLKNAILIHSSDNKDNDNNTIEDLLLLLATPCALIINENCFLDFTGRWLKNSDLTNQEASDATSGTALLTLLTPDSLVAIAQAMEFALARHSLQYFTASNLSPLISSLIQNGIAALCSRLGTSALRQQYSMPSFKILLSFVNQCLAANDISAHNDPDKYRAAVNAVFSHYYGPAHSFEDGQPAVMSVEDPLRRDKSHINTNIISLDLAEGDDLTNDDCRMTQASQVPERQCFPFATWLKMSQILIDAHKLVFAMQRRELERLYDFISSISTHSNPNKEGPGSTDTVGAEESNERNCEGAGGTSVNESTQTTKKDPIDDLAHLHRQIDAMEEEMARTEWMERLHLVQTLARLVLALLEPLHQVIREQRSGAAHRPADISSRGHLALFDVAQKTAGRFSGSLLHLQLAQIDARYQNPKGSSTPLPTHTKDALGAIGDAPQQELPCGSDISDDDRVSNIDEIVTMP